MNTNNEVLSQKEQDALMEKYDPEARTRKVTGITAAIVFIGLLSFSLFHLYTGAFGQFTAYIQRTVHLGFALTLVFLLFPARRKTAKNSVPWYDYLLALASVIVCGYWPFFYETLVQQFGGINTAQLIIGIAAILLVLEATRRAVGLPIIIIAGAFMVYALFGPYMPGILAHRGLSIEQFVHTMFFTTQGILGTLYKFPQPLSFYFYCLAHF